MYVTGCPYPWPLSGSRLEPTGSTFAFNLLVLILVDGAATANCNPRKVREAGFEPPPSYQKAVVLISPAIPGPTFFSMYSDKIMRVLL